MQGLRACRQTMPPAQQTPQTPLSRTSLDLACETSQTHTHTHTHTYTLVS